MKEYNRTTGSQMQVTRVLGQVARRVVVQAPVAVVQEPGSDPRP
jgi:hypothetical protein